MDLQQLFILWSDLLNFQDLSRINIEFIEYFLISLHSRFHDFVEQYSELFRGATFTKTFKDLLYALGISVNIQFKSSEKWNIYFCLSVCAQVYILPYPRKDPALSKRSKLSEVPFSAAI